MEELKMLVLVYVLFVGLIGAEWAVSWFRSDGWYRTGEAASNVSHGIVYQVTDFFTKGLVMVPFVYVSTQWAPVQLPMDQWWGWLLGVLALDFCFYWYHRHSHEVSALWAVHAVHHAAEDYNLAAALRQPAFQHAFSWLYRLPLALFVPVEMFVGLIVFDFFYQFLLHTRYVGKLGPVEWVMNTPSHHRVHHGRDEEYLDKNYGGIFIVWDRLFGTFKEERQEPVFGVTKPINSLNPIWGNLHFFAELVEASRRAPTWRNAVLVWLAGPAHTDRLAPGGVIEARTNVDDADLSLGLRVGVLAAGLPIIGALSWLILRGEALGTPAQVAVAAGIVISVALGNSVLERGRSSVEGRSGFDPSLVQQLE